MMINDVKALRVPGALEAVAEGGVTACLMHMQGQPPNMQVNPQYDDVVHDVKVFLCNAWMLREPQVFRGSNW